MSGLFSLVDRAMGFIESHAPKHATIAGQTYLCTIDYVGKSENFAESTRQRDAKLHVTAVFRAGVLPAVPKIGSPVTVAGVTYKVMNFEDDEAGITLHLDNSEN